MTIFQPQKPRSAEGYTGMVVCWV